MGVYSVHSLKVKKALNFISVFFGCSATILALTCFIFRLPIVLSNNYSKLGLISAKFILPNADKLKNSSGYISPVSDNKLVKNDSSAAKCPGAINGINSLSEAAPDSSPYTAYNGNEKVFKVIESQFKGAGIKYGNFYVKNNTNFNLNIENELLAKPDIKIQKNGKAEILIFHTHTSEAYMEKDEGFYTESYYPRSTDYNHNVTRVGDSIKQVLESSGIKVIHDLTYHDSPSYNGSYSRAAKTIKGNLGKYPSIQVVLDIHRDAIGNNDSGKVKPTFVYNGKKAAQIMIISGCDMDSSMSFPNWEKNLRFALRLQQCAETMYPGMTRPLKFDRVKYNMDITHGSLLIEVGSDSNTLEEAIYTGSLLGNALACVLSKLN